MAWAMPWMCWAWGRPGAMLVVTILVSSLRPSFCRTAWPWAPERFSGLRSAIKTFWLVPWAKATETRLSESATASSRASPSFLDKMFLLFYFLVRLLDERVTCSHPTRITLESLPTRMGIDRSTGPATPPRLDLEYQNLRLG